MCGIAGLVNFTEPLTGTTSLLKRMLGRIQYRGPDESGIYVNRNIGLGNVRLSIIDLAKGQQPLSDNDETCWIVYNGEIFNYIELKNELLKKGHRFNTESDTEVLLHLYREYGSDCLNMLNGQFAFAIWNNLNQELFLARDRVGIRPLFYIKEKNTLLFASEMKCLFEFENIKPEFDYMALSQVLSLWTTITPRTIFKGIKELPPGHWMKIDKTGQKLCQYWKPDFPAGDKGLFTGSVQEAGEELDRLLTDAVRLRLRADVPVAAYLSGGIDSSATTYYINKIAPDNLQTFSIGFEDNEFDETSYQQEVSQYLKTNHTAFSCTNADIGKYFPTVVWHSEMPLLRTAPVPMYCLSKQVRSRNIKVVITGEGADEMLAGYDIFKETIIREFWSKQPDSKYRPLLLQKLYPYIYQFQGRNKSMFKFFFGYKLEETDSPFYSHLIRWQNTRQLQNYFSNDVKAIVSEYLPYNDILEMLSPDFQQWNKLSQAQWLEIIFFMSGYLLSAQGDRVAMANSVEGRYPFLDYRVIEFCASLPPDYKMKGLNEKYLLKKIMAGRLPDRIVKRNKQAYRSPIADSFLSSPAREYVMELLSERDINRAGLFSYPSVQKLINKIRAADIITEMDNMAFAGIISTQLLYHQYILKDSFRPGLSRLSDCRVIHESNPLYS
jgi:asparagine synthase (glutamine-hydrolysing)